MFYRWDAPDGRSVIFHGPVIEKLRGRVIEAFLSLPRRGAETGGLLLGRLRSGSPPVVQIEQYEEIPCQHRFGPSYVLDETDREGLVRALTRERSVDEPVVVGFYRSFTGRDMALEDGDADLMRTHFPSESSVFLLLKPTAADACEASFIFWDRGELRPESPYPVLQFKASEMVEDGVEEAAAGARADNEKRGSEAPAAVAANGQERQERPEVAAAKPAARTDQEERWSPRSVAKVEEPQPEPEVRPEAAPMPEPKQRSVPAAAVAANGEARRAQPEVGAMEPAARADQEKRWPAPPVAKVAQAEERQEQAKKDSGSAAAAIAAKVEDQPVQPEARAAEPAPDRERRRPVAPVSLPPAHPPRVLEDSMEIRKPRIARRRRIWAPLAACVAVSVGAAFVWELWSLAREPRWSQLHLDARQTATGINLVWDRTAGAVDDAQRGVLSIDDNSGHHEVELTAAQIQAGQYTYPAGHDDILFRLTLYGAGIQASGDSLRVMNTRSSSPAVEPASATAKTAAPAPAKAAQPESSESRPPVSGDATQHAASEPVILHEVHPNVPAGIRTRIRERIVIPVEVQVSAAGRVTSAVPQRNGDTLHRYLADLAATAARSWRFSPARTKNGQPTAGAKTIYFIFAPSV